MKPLSWSSFPKCRRIILLSSDAFRSYVHLYVESNLYCISIKLVRIVDGCKGTVYNNTQDNKTRLRRM